MQQVGEKPKICCNITRELWPLRRAHAPWHLWYSFKIFIERVSNPHGIVDTSSWQSSCLSTLDQSQLFDLHFSQLLSNHAGLVFHCAARSIWPPRIVFLGMAPSFSSFSFSPSFFFKNKVISMFTMTLNATHSHNASRHGLQGCSSKQCPCQS